MNVNRVRHLENALNHFERSQTLAETSLVSIDSHLRSYFRAHKGKVLPRDREWISEKFKDIYRWRSLVDHFSLSDKSVANRLRTYFGNQSWRSYSDSKTLPEHIRVSIPESLYSRLSNHYGKAKSLDIGRIWNEPSSTYLRVNSLIEDRERLLKALTSRGVCVEKTAVSELGLKVTHAEDLSNSPELEDHACGFQDESCQIIGLQVDVKPGEKVLDYCAGSGGKSLVFGPKLKGKGHLFLHDVNDRYLIQARHKLKGAGLKNFTCLSPDSIQLKKLKGMVDWILVDPPSTGSGHYRRYPDRKWLYSDNLLNEKILNQRDIFQNALRYLKRGGKIVYATSSILPEENAEQIKYFCDKHKLFLSSEPVYSLPQSRGMDGFFCAVLEHQ
jgi:16S rRNA (cytosine967-C5)-methyltransferase